MQIQLFETLKVNKTGKKYYLALRKQVFYPNIVNLVTVHVARFPFHNASTTLWIGPQRLSSPVIMIIIARTEIGTEMRAARKKGKTNETPAVFSIHQVLSFSTYLSD